MKIKARRNSIKSSIDMTPMLDVVFQLIIFFSVSTTFAVLPGIKLQLPASETAENTSNLGITISADKNGAIWFNGVQVSYTDLEKELLSYDTQKIKKKDFPVTFEADSEVTNGTIVKVFDVVRKTGYSAVSLRTTETEVDKTEK